MLTGKKCRLAVRGVYTVPGHMVSFSGGSHPATFGCTGGPEHADISSGRDILVDFAPLFLECSSHAARIVGWNVPQRIRIVLLGLT
jgi:hypothetical protein